MKFNMTPIIDIVFLLIIFLVVVCRQIDAENFDVAVPDKCRFAQPVAENPTATITVTVARDAENGELIFAVGSEPTTASVTTDITAWLTKKINQQLSSLSAATKTLSLRIDKDVRYFNAQKVLAAVAGSNAVKIQLVTLKQVSP
ncbi:MAG: hypothetical protein GWO86_01405 [Planctomycetes bacterium]|nr:hypothetical protein [Planctomycetota bacterium]